MELTLFVDHQCNLRCSYCYTGEKFTRPMSRQTMEKAVALALSGQPARLGVSFFGGEPLVHLDFVRATVEHVEETVAAMADPIPIRFFMNTNATLIDDHAIELMSAPRGFEVYASLDGPREVHDAFRKTATGKGSFDDVLAGLERVRAAGILFHVLGVINPSTARSLPKTVETLLPLGAEKIHLAPNYGADWTDETIAELREALTQTGDLWMAEFRAGRAVGLEPLHSKILSHLKGGMPCPSRCLLGGCEWAVSPAGNIYACAQMVGEDRKRELVIGTVDGGIDLEGLMGLQRAKDRVEQTCAECELRDRCQSHCGCRHLALSGELGVITATLCELEAAFIDEADRVAEVLYDEQCEAFLGYYYGRQWTTAPGGKLTETRKARDD
ncbi:MAG: radical SAM protein [Deltaproteobacteria bacterium]|jgi:uncharacterized protein|nr:radical SAM protein [Deltaproteobacteria bacterium]MBW2534854.1 radical SAM protein [Deltaproteobacteria bacterium]